MPNIPVFEPFLLGNEGAFVQEALAAGEISGTSPTVERFERELAQALSVDYAVAAANGTAALHLAMLALGVKPGDEVILPNSTIISNAIAVVLCGATPVFVDVSKEDWCLDVEQLEQAITERTVGFTAVHLYGQVCDLDALTSMARRKGLWLLEDAAQSMAATWRGRTVGAFGDIGCYSFYANKLITTGEGGAVTTSNERLYERLVLLRNLGFDPNPERRFIHSQLGHNYRLSSLQAAMGRGQLAGLQTLKALRDRIRSDYQRFLRSSAGVILPVPDPRCRSDFWMCALLLAPEVKVSVPALQAKLRASGIDTRRFFYPLNRQPALVGLHRQEHANFPISDMLFERGLYLPSSSKLTEEEIAYICEALHREIENT